MSNKPKLPGRNTLKKRICPGLWIDTDDNPHISIDELMQVAGLEDTPINRKLVTQMAVDMVNEAIPDAEVWHRAKPD